jgi:hypothetical protein
LPLLLWRAALVPVGGDFASISGLLYRSRSAPDWNDGGGLFHM